jgi:hypothetical protein
VSELFPNEFDIISDNHENYFSPRKIHDGKVSGVSICRLTTAGNWWDAPEV